jgi:hypothetical protein
MRFDDLDDAIREAIAQEVEEARPQLLGLEGRVVERLAAQPLRPRWRLWRELALPRRRWWAEALGVALALVIGFALGHLLTSGPSPLSAPGSIFAVLSPGAQAVAVVGDFSAWQPVPLSDLDGDGIWTATLELPPGRYEYAFLVDGRWIGQDPRADEYVRSFGEYASVRYVGGGT